jgi:predicted ATPase
MGPLIRRVVLRNYKSIAACDVELAPLTLLVGPNGAGKSNFLDALRFVTDALTTTLEHALRDRGGIANVRRRSRGHPTHFGIALHLALRDGRSARYAFTVAAEKGGTFSVQREDCEVSPSGALGDNHFFHVEGGSVRGASEPIQSVIEPDRLALVTVSALPAFRPVYDALAGMGFYNLNPERIRDLQDVDAGQKLARDGRNIAAVLREMARAGGQAVLDRISEELRAVVPGVVSVQPKTLGPKETLEFGQRVKGDENPWGFLAASMSDGTLRALGVLVAVHQASVNGARRVTLVGIEEPEAAIHPGAAEVLLETLRAASDDVQVLVTTHSPELLDHPALTDAEIRAVDMVDGRTVVGEVDAASRSALRDRLYTAGELLRQGQIKPSEEAYACHPDQVRLFDGE